MTTRSRVDPYLAVLVVAVLALFLPKLAFAETPLYRQVLTPRVLLAVGCAMKIAALVGAAGLASRVALTFAAGDTMRRGWWLAMAWLAAWAVAQSYLGVFQIGLGTSAPFPSGADVFFMLGYPAMITAFVLFVRAVDSTGLVGPLRAQLGVALLAALPAAAVLVAVLRPVLAADAPPLERALNVAYPALDVVALIPALVLARFALRLAGGALFVVWMSLSSGIVCMVAGDLLYAWFSSLGFAALDPLLDVAFIMAYLLVARAVYQQHRISVLARGRGDAAPEHRPSTSPPA